jgi:hypothetical protein
MNFPPSFLVIKEWKWGHGSDFGPKNGKNNKMIVDGLGAL